MLVSGSIGHFASKIALSTIAELMIAAIMMASTAIETNAKPFTLYQTSKALIIGASRYQGSWSSLDTVPSEIQMVGKAVVDQGFEVEILMDPDGPTMSSTIRRFLAQRTMRDTRLLVYFAGHGWTDGQYTGYLIPTDLTTDDEQDIVERAVSLEDIKNWAHPSRAKHIVFIFDSCFSGAVFLTRNNIKPSELFLQDADQPVRQFITAGSATEPVPSRSDFAPALVRGLAGEADLFGDGIITGTELGYWLKAEITPKGKQTPQFGSDPDARFRSGDVVFKATSRFGPQNPQEPVIVNLTGSANVAGNDGRLLRGSVKPTSVKRSVFEGVEVLYYQKLADGERIRLALDKAEIPYLLTRAQIPENIGVDTIACGPDTPIEAVKELAEVMLNNNISLRSIVSFRNPANKRSRIELVSLGVQTKEGILAFDTRKELTLSDIRSLDRCRDLQKFN